MTTHEVRWAGAQRDVLSGDLSAHVDLEALSTLPNVYGLGPLEGLRGEVSIFGAVPSIARIEGDRVVTASTWRARACFLVWASLPAWSERPAGRRLADLAAIEADVVALAEDMGLDPGRPVPFRIRGDAVRATLHVLDKRDGLPHNEARHDAAKVRRTLEAVPVELVGFYSRRHHGVFTPKDANVHVHLRTADGAVSGHLEAISLSAATIAVPGSGWPH